MKHEQRGFRDFFANVLGGRRFAAGSDHAEEHDEAGHGGGPRVEVFAMGPNGPLEDLQAELQRELEGLFSGDCNIPGCSIHGGSKKEDEKKTAEQKVDWRRKLAEFKIGIPVEVNTRIGIVGMLGLQAWQIAEMKANANGRSLKRTLQEALGELHMAIAESTTSQNAIAEVVADYGKALAAAAQEHEELLGRLSAARASAACSQRSLFSYGDVSRLTRLVANGLKEGETYLPQEGLSTIEQQLKSAERTVNRLAEVQAMLAGIGGQEKVAALMSSIFGTGDLNEALNEFVGAPVVVAEPIGEVLEIPPAEINA